ncbi:MAG: DUF6134 family protein [Rhodovibrionaceae bacterium]
MRSIGRAKPFAAAALCAAAILASPALASLPGNGSIVFEVLRGGEPMGTHSLRFEKRGEDLHVFIDIDLKVDLAFVTVFRYEHSNHEIWRDGRLISIETTTDDDGETYFVKGEATAAGFQVTSSEGKAALPADILPTSYWHPQTVARDRLLDTQKGRIVEVATRELRQEAISIDGLRIEATHYRMTGDLDLELWYAPNGEWVKIAFETRGAEIVYARENGGPQLTKRAAE